MTQTRHAITAGIFALIGLAGAAQAAPVEFGFTRIEPHNASVNPATQFKLLVDSVSGSQVSFKFKNIVGIQSSI
jgi:hypothetical protein